jgi:hypothetical protein
MGVLRWDRAGLLNFRQQRLGGLWPGVAEFLWRWLAFAGDAWAALRLKLLLRQAKRFDRKCLKVN